MTLPRHKRYIPTIKARVKQRLRRDLVHAAGCAVKGCIFREDREVVDEFLCEAILLGVRIPRSLRARAEKFQKALGDGNL